MWRGGRRCESSVWRLGQVGFGGAWSLWGRRSGGSGLLRTLEWVDMARNEGIRSRRYILIATTLYNDDVIGNVYG